LNLFTKLIHIEDKVITLTLKINKLVCDLKIMGSYKAYMEQNDCFIKFVLLSLILY